MKNESNLKTNEAGVTKTHKWVKATERVPKTNGSYYIRDTRDGRKSIGWYSERGKNSYLKTRAWFIEWLDETECDHKEVISVRHAFKCKDCDTLLQ